MIDFTLVAHDLRSPLDVILGHMHLLAAEPLSDDARRRLAIVEAQARRMVRLLDTCSDEDIVVLTRDGVDVGALITSIASELDPRMAHHGIAATLTIDSGLPLVLGDIDLLHRALLNLLNNAIEATASGGHIAVRARAEASGGGPGERIAIEIIDSGSGIPPEMLPRIFDRGFTTKQQARHGLGLSITRDIIHRHGGDMSIASQSGQGTSVYLSLPAQVTAIAAPQRTSN